MGRTRQHTELSAAPSACVWPAQNCRPHPECWVSGAVPAVRVGWPGHMPGPGMRAGHTQQRDAGMANASSALQGVPSYIAQSHACEQLEKIQTQS